MDADVLGPETLLWRYAGDRRSTHLGGSIGLLQLMHPAIGAAVIDHSDFFGDPLARVARSLPAILGAVYDGPEASETGAAVRDRHASIAGVDTTGRRYHALTPETFWWAHATFQYMVEQIVDRFDDHELTDAERERLYQEGLGWYRQYGVDDGEVPPTRAAFQVKFDHYCAEVLEMNEAVEYVLDTLEHPFRLPLPGLLGHLHPVLRRLPSPRVITVPAYAMAVGGLPQLVRQRFGLPYSRTHERARVAIEWSNRKGWPLLPAVFRWHPRARAGWKRVGRRPPR